MSFFGSLLNKTAAATRKVAAGSRAVRREGAKRAQQGKSGFFSGVFAQSGRIARRNKR